MVLTSISFQFFSEACEPWGPTDVVEASRGQPLGEVGRKQKTGEEGEEEVVTMTGEGVALTAASPKPQEDLKKRRK